LVQDVLDRHYVATV